MNNKYKISVIMPIYNAEGFLEEAIESVVRQTIGFEKNVQLILVNDGSPDNSDSICRKYQKRFPNNVTYIEKENGGVSSARNEGIKRIQGKYTIFLDADDKWECSAFNKIYNYFEHHKNVFDVCSCKIEFIGDFKGKIHPLNYKFSNGKRVVDLLDEAQIINTTIGNTVFRSTAIKGHQFNEIISSGEDSEFVNTVLLNNPSVGLLPKAVFYYRRNYIAGSGSSSAPNKKSWYFEIPREYYLGLCKKSMLLRGNVPEFIQFVILYDMRWRHFNANMMDVLTEEEKELHISIMHEVMMHIEDRVLTEAKGMNQYKKLYLLSLKYGKQIIDYSHQQGAGFYFGNQKVLSLREKLIFEVKALSISNDVLYMDGITRINAIHKDNRLYIKVDDKECTIVRSRYEKADIKGFIGEPIVESECFHVEVPIKIGSKIHFLAETEGQRIKLKPYFNSYIGIYKSINNNYCVKAGYIIKLRNNVLSFYRDNRKTRTASEVRLLKEMIRKKGIKWIGKRANNLKIRHNIHDSVLKNQVAFISIRDDKLTGNLAKVYEETKLPKVKYSKRGMYHDIDAMLQATRLVYASKVVVTDDYLFLFRDNQKKIGQKYIQLWHASGAGKCFGQDGTNMFPAVDKSYHRDYDIVTVSSEGIKNIYASAFDLPVEKIAATGVARTDDFFNERLIESTRKKIYKQYPEFRGKRIIIYTPTFRDIPGVPRSMFKPDLDFDSLSKTLQPDQVFVICPHPVMTEPIIEYDYGNIIEVRDVSTSDMMYVADLLITDYSSTIFDYSLLNKPMAFFCYDYDDYDRNFYFDYNSELPGPLLKTQEELISYLEQCDYSLPDSYSEFRKKYMGACDGKSTDRIVKLIEDLFYGRE